MEKNIKSVQIKEQRVLVIVRLPEQMKKELFSEAEKIGISGNDYILIALREYLNSQT